MKNATSKSGNSHNFTLVDNQKILAFIQKEIDDHDCRRNLIGNSFGDHLSWRIVLMIAWSKLKNRWLSIGDMSRDLDCPKPLLSRIVNILSNDGVIHLEYMDGFSEQILNFTKIAEINIFNYFYKKYGFEVLSLENA